jgi:hypothetical protein
MNDTAQSMRLALLLSCFCGICMLLARLCMIDEHHADPFCKFQVKMGGNVYLPHDCRSCSDNPNKEFADCCIPQEKSDAEINRDLEISENSECDEEDGTNATCEKPMEVCIQGGWTCPAS